MAIASQGNQTWKLTTVTNLAILDNQLNHSLLDIIRIISGLQLTGTHTETKSPPLDGRELHLGQLLPQSVHINWMKLVVDLYKFKLTGA